MSDIAPFGLRMQSALKEKLDREARINGRSLNAEIVHRLGASFAAAARRELADTEQAEYKARDVKNPDYLPALSDADRQILAVFRRLPVEKQLALISLFK